MASRELEHSPGEPVLSEEVGTWHVWIDETPRPGWCNMALDRVLLDRAEMAGESWLRLYSWEPHCLSFGRHEPAARRYDADLIASLGIDTVRRPTGGRAVWHSNELTYAIAGPTTVFGSLRQAYFDIHRALADALRSVDVAAWLAPVTRSLPIDAGACFANPAGGEVMVGARKVVGSAQLRLTRGFLQHGSILLHDEQQMLTALMRGQDESEVTHTPALLKQDWSVPDLIEAISRSVQARWPGIRVPLPRSGEMLQSATRYSPQFRSVAWTWDR
jgi:lipoyl(octanoyl) transferase